MKKYDTIIITNLPAFYKINLFNEINKRKKIYVVFTGTDAGQRNADFLEQRRSSVAGLTEYPTDSVHEEWQVGDTVQLRTEPFEL